MKQLSGFMVLEIKGGLRVSYTYDEVDEHTGKIISSNNKGDFYAMDQTLISSIRDIQTYIRENLLNV